ncbi:hypothetical protein N9Z15_04635, partial [Akkermansiaceae bacterium]|nr:hypothetical protein [Akkermansiaceae bacterium]
MLGDEHFSYPGNHIEADNRLTWFLGDLERRFGNNAYYVHLLRNRAAVARSFRQRFDSGIIKAYNEDIILNSGGNNDRLLVCEDYVDTVTHNIEAFLKNKDKKLTVQLENVDIDFPRFWQSINAKGDLKTAMNEWRTPKNASGTPEPADYGPVG